MTRGSCAHDVTTTALCSDTPTRSDPTDVIAYHVTQPGQLGEGREELKGDEKELNGRRLFAGLETTERGEQQRETHGRV